VVDNHVKRLSKAVLRIEGHSVPFRGSAIVPTILFFLSRALKRCLSVYTRVFLEWTSFGTFCRVRTPKQTQGFLQPLHRTVLPELVGEPETLLVDSTLLGHPPQATQSAARQRAGSTKDFVGMTSSQHSSRRHRARSPAKQRRRPSYARTSQTLRSAPLDKPIMVGCVCL
jgi:hypothetical protein